MNRAKLSQPPAAVISLAMSALNCALWAAAAGEGGPSFSREAGNEPRRVMAYNIRYDHEHGPSAERQNRTRHRRRQARRRGDLQALACARRQPDGASSRVGERGARTAAGIERAARRFG